MQNISKERLNVLETINIGSMIENFNPNSMQGSTLKKNLSTAFNEGRLQKVSSVIDVIVECANIRHIDKASSDMFEILTEKLNESVKTKLVYCVETLDQERQNTLHESLRSTIDQLIVLEDAEIVNKIRSGALSTFKSIQSVHFIIESVQIVSDVVSETDSHKAYHPVSYTEISESKTAFIRLHNQVFAINESTLIAANSPSYKFGFLSSIVENLEFDYTNESFSIEHATLGTFNISENQITRQPVGSEEILEHANGEELRNAVTMIIESAGAGSNRATKIQIEENKKFIDAITAVQENFDNISLANNIVVVETLRNAEKFAFVQNSGTSHVITLKSNRMPNIVESFKDIREGLRVLEKKSGYNASHFFTNDLTIVQEHDQVTSAKVDALHLVIESLESKTKEIKNLIAETRAAQVQNPKRLLKLNEALQLNEALMFEQKTNLSQLLVV